MEFCQDSQFKLEIVPSSTEEYVDSLTFLDEIQEQVHYLLNRLHARDDVLRLSHTPKSLRKPEMNTTAALHLAKHCNHKLCVSF